MKSFKIILNHNFRFLINFCKGLPGADARKVSYDPKDRVKKNLEEGKGFRLVDGSGN